MIKTVFDLHEYLAADLSRLEKKPNLKDWLLKNESWFIWRYIYLLRHVEYHLNSRHKLRYLWYFFFYNRVGFKLHFTIYPNTIGPGFRIYHIGDFVHVGSNVRIGKNVHCCRAWFLAISMKWQMEGIYLSETIVILALE